MNDTPPASPAKPRRPWWKKLLFRLLAVLLGLLPLVILELGLRAFDIGNPVEQNDPFVGFSDIHPLFVLNKKTGEYEIPRSRQTHFRPEHFPANKGQNDKRVFVLGGSTVQGRPYQIETSFTTALEICLQAADDSHQWDVINCGGVSYASYRLTPMLKEVLTYQPDVIIICTGQNEFLEDRSYAHIKYASGALVWPQKQASRLRIFNVFRGAVRSLTGSEEPTDERPRLEAEADARLDWKGGMEKYHRDEHWQRVICDHYESSLGRMVRMTQEANVPLLLMVPVSNLQWPPFKSQHREGITAEQREQFHRLLNNANGGAREDMLREAIRIDDRYALAHYRLGSLLFVQKRYAEAEAALTRAKEEDICPLRMLERMRKDMVAVAEDTSTPLINAHELLARECRGGFPNQDYLVDHVHPSIPGHRLLGEALAHKMIDLGWTKATADWEERAREKWNRHLNSLGNDYHQKAKNRLDAVQRWAHGLTDREKREKTP